MTVLDETPVSGPAPEPPTPLSRNREFVLLWTGAGLSVLGTKAAVAAYPLLMLWYGGSPGNAGLVGFASLLPQLLLLLPAGALVDRWDRRRLMISCDAVGLLSMGSLAVALFAGHLWLVHVMVAAFLEGGAVVFYRLAERAAVRRVVPAGQLPAALSRNEARGHAAGLLGQPTGAALFTALRWMPFGVAACTHLLALLALLLIRKDLQGERSAPPQALRVEISEGIAWVLRQRFMRAAIILVGGSNLVFQALNLALVLIIKQGGHSPFAVGLIGVIEGVGGVLGALTASWFLRRVPLPAVLIGAFVIWATLMVPIALTSSPLVLGVLCAGISYAGALMNVAASIHQVQVTPDEMQGRAASVFGLVGSGMNSGGALVGGVLLAFVGTTGTVLGSSAAMAALAVAAVATPAIRRAGREKPDSSEEI